MTEVPNTKSDATPGTERAIPLLRAGREAEAHALCEAALAADPHDEIALQVMGVLRGRAGDTEGALSHMRRAVMAAPGNPANYNNLGVYLAYLNRHAEAIASYDAALERDPGMAEAQANRMRSMAALEESGVSPLPVVPVNVFEQRLRACEHAVYTRAPDGPWLLRNLLAHFTTSANPLTKEQAARLASAFGTYVTMAALPPEQPIPSDVMLLSHMTHSLFVLTPFGDTDHLVRALGAEDTASMMALAANDHARFVQAATLFGLDSRLPIDPEAIFAAGLDLALPLYLGLLATRFVRTHAGAARREQLIDLGVRLEGATAPDRVHDLRLFSNAWMNCSYAARADKHQVKRTLNRIARKLMLDSGLRDVVLPAPRPRPERPTLVVAAEVMQSQHVQFRYFVPYLKQLRTRFRLVLLTEASEVDEHVRPLFDDMVLFRDGDTAGALRPAAQQVIAHRPDIVLWLSVGMKYWGVLLANLRFAPIQIAGLGHSATTHCDTIDYYLTEAGFVARPETMSEQVILLPDATLRFAVPPGRRAPNVAIRPQANPIQIAIAANLLKLNPGFIEMLATIRARASRPIAFAFFPNAQGLEYAAAAASLTERLPGAVVHPRIHPTRYDGILSACDLSLSPFPFGGMHSVVDCLRLGIPVVAMSSLDLHGQTDRMLLRRAGMPEWLVAADEPAYIAAALRLIDDDETRVALSRQAAALDIDRILFETPDAPPGTDVVDAVWWLMRDHEAIKASGRKTFTHEDWH